MDTRPLTLQKVGWSVLAGLSVAYSVAVLAYVSTAQEIRIQCLLTNSGAGRDAGGLEDGLEVESTTGLKGAFGDTPSPGDYLLTLGGWHIHSFVDLSQAIAELRTRPLTSSETLPEGTDPTEEPEFASSTITLVQQTKGYKFAKCLFRRGDSLLVGWLPMEPQSAVGITVSIVWLVLQLGVLLIAGLAHWHRPYDRPLRIFFISAFVAMVAFIGGSHWWVICGNLWLLVPFAIAAILLPAVLLHFFLLYPAPRRWLVHRAGVVLTCVYAVPVAAAVGAVAMIVAGSSFSTLGDQPLALVCDRVAADWIRWLLQGLREGISGYLLLSAGYFLLSVGLLAYAFFRSRQRVEHEQVRWILAAAATAILPLGYCLWKSQTDRVEIAFGGAQLPLFVASLLFTIAYAVGIVRHRLMLIDQVLDRGLLYYFVSFAVTLVFSMTVAYGTMTTLHQDLGVVGQPILVFVVANVAVIALVWLRDRLQRGVDREFFREKYQLDRALQRVNQAVTGMLDRRTVADRVLASCQDVLQANRGAIYLRDEHSPLFYRLATIGGGEFPAEFSAPRDFIESLRSGLSLQRVRSGHSPIQQSMRTLDAELVHGLDVDGSLAGMVVLGAKPNGASYNAEDAAFLTAMGRMAGVTLHFGKVHEDLTRMNADFVRLNDELERRNAVAEELRDQLRLKEGVLAQGQRQIDALQYQLSLHRPSETTVVIDREFDAPTILGGSAPMRSVLDTVRKVATTDASVLVRGESGTGKELLARAIHDNSPRRDGPLVTIHCAALAPGVLESELFGHVRGAFTDARQDKQGRFQLASGGTLFLDEIGDVPLETQVKLLRVLQERVIEPVGSSQAVPVDVRLIAATHRNLEEFIASGRFREDLYYRLNVVSITLPPLRERGDDVVELAVKFLRRAALRTSKPVSHFDEPVLDLFRQYAWPGNIRELENVVERAVVLADQDVITLDDLPPVLRNWTPQVHRPSRLHNDDDGTSNLSRAAALMAAPNPTMAAHPELFASAGGVSVIGSEEERQLLREALTKARGNKARAARLLGMPRSTYFSKLRKHGLE